MEPLATGHWLPRRQADVGTIETEVTDVSFALPSPISIGELLYPSSPCAGPRSAEPRFGEPVAQLVLAGLRGIVGDQHPLSREIGLDALDPGDGR